MSLLGTIVNAAAILVGGSIGIFLKKGLPERVRDTLMKGNGLVVLYIGISGALEGNKTLVAILSVALGGLIGALIDIDKGMNRLGEYAQEKLAKGDDNNTFTQGFVSASVLFCVGAMAVVGSLQDGLSGNHETLFAKSILDGITSIIMASTLGPGVLLSALPVFLYQGLLTVLAGIVGPYLSEGVVAEMTCVGSLLIVGIGLNLLEVTKLKIANYLPAIFLPILLYNLL